MDPSDPPASPEAASPQLAVPTFALTTPAPAFGTGEVLGETFGIFFSSPVPLLVTAVVLLPLSVLTQGLAAALEGSPYLERLMGALNLVDSLLVTPIATGAVVYTVFQRMRGNSPGVGDSLRVGLSSLGPVVGVAILQGLATALGMLLCILPGILFALMYSLAVPVAVEERPGIGASMSRSSDLTQNHRLSIFWVLVSLYLLTLGLALFAGMLATLNKTVEVVLTFAVQVLAVGLAATATTVMYYRLRSVKESLDVDRIASVFD